MHREKFLKVKMLERLGGKFKHTSYHLKNPGLKAHALAGCHAGGKLA